MCSFLLFSHLLLIQGHQYPKSWVLSFLLFDVYLSTCVYMWTLWCHSKHHPLFKKKSPDTNFVTLYTLHLELMFAINCIETTSWFLRQTWVPPLSDKEFKGWQAINTCTAPKHNLILSKPVKKKKSERFFFSSLCEGILPGLYI